MAIRRQRRRPEPTPEAVLAAAGRRHEMQVFVAGLLSLTGWATLLGGPRPGSLSAALDPPLLYTWAVTCALGGTAMVAAAIVRSPTVGVQLELVAAPPLALLLLAYASAALTSAGGQAIVAAALSVGLAAAFLVRTVRAGRTLRKLRGR